MDQSFIGADRSRYERAVVYKQGERFANKLQNGGKPTRREMIDEISQIVRVASVYLQTSRRSKLAAFELLNLHIQMCKTYHEEVGGQAITELEISTVLNRALDEAEGKV